MDLQDWRLVAATVIGTSHEKTALPCQDAHACEVLEGNERVLVVIASDGAGSATRSDAGSHMACNELLENVRSYLDSGKAIGDVSREIALGWLENAAARILHAAEREGLPAREFACTILAGLLTETHAVFLQIGDGAMVIRPRGDDWCYVFWPQHGEYINTTVFLTDPTALANFEFCVNTRPIDEIAAFTDGIESLVLHYATESVHAPFFDGVFPAVRSLSLPGFSDALSEKLVGYLASPAICDRTDDDKTLILGSRIKRPPSRALVPIGDAF